MKGQFGVYQFKTKIQKKTLTPKWFEEFKIPIITWDSPNVLAIEVHDKDIFVDDTLGFVSKLLYCIMLSSAEICYKLQTIL